MKIWRAGGAFRLIFTYPDLSRGSDGNVRKDLCSFNVLTHQHQLKIVHQLKDITWLLVKGFVTPFPSFFDQLRRSCHSADQNLHPYLIRQLRRHVHTVSNATFAIMIGSID